MAFSEMQPPYSQRYITSVDPLKDSSPEPRQRHVATSEIARSMLSALAAQANVPPLARLVHASFTRRVRANTALPAFIRNAGMRARGSVHEAFLNSLPRGFDTCTLLGSSSSSGIFSTSDG